MKDPIRFNSKIGLIAATVGSAVGLGNVWRFPAEVQANGGAAFLLIYLGCVIMLGIPVMLAEFSLGRAGRTDAVGVFQKLSPGKKWWLIGLLGIIASFTILSFYMVVSGWTLEYLVESLTGNLYRPDSGSGEVNFGEKMVGYVQSDSRPLLYTYIMIVLNVGILLGGVRKGIERISNWLMPTLFVLLIVFCCVSLSMPDAGAGLKYFFKPDFTKIDAGVIVSALGQAFFSLSLGLGVLITYASYFPKETRLVRTGVTVAVLDLFVAILMGIIIFPVVTSFGITDGESLRGGTLVFVTMPEVFSHMSGTQLWSTLFFLSITVAALTSTLSLGQVSIAFLQDRFKMSRGKAVALVLLPLIPLSTACSLSQGSWNSFKLAGYNLFDLLDNVATNYMLPIGAILLCIYAGWVFPKKTLTRELTNDGELKGTIAPAIRWCIKYAAPPLIFIILISKML